MEETESQIAKIVLGNNKSSTTYVHVVADKAAQSEDEIYMVAELPMFNPAAKEACERICLAIASTLKRGYKSQKGSNGFENTLNLINEELGKLAATGQTEWVNKLNCILAAKNGQTFHIATCGKTAAYLLRHKEFTDISSSQEKNHPLKTFENFASGKISLNDILVLSTVQLFNYVSMDRLMNILSTADFLTASRTVIELLKQTAEPTVSFGVILNLQTLPGVNLETEADLENYTVKGPSKLNSLVGSTTGYVKNIFAWPAKRKANTALPGITFSQKIRAFGSGTLNQGRNVWNKAKTGARNAREFADITRFRQMAPAKRFLFISIAILLLASVFSLYAAVRIKSKNTNHQAILEKLQEVQNFLSSSESSLLYQDDTKAADFFQKAIASMPAEDSVDDENQELYNQVKEEITKTQSQMEKAIEVEPQNLGSLGQADFMVKLPNYLAVQANQSIVSYSFSSGKVEDSLLKSPSFKMLATANVSENLSVVYDGSNLYAWDSSNGSVGPSFSQNLPNNENFGGLSWYKSASKAYVIDKGNQTIFNFTLTSNTFSKPSVSVKNSVLSSAVDLAIDGNIYVLTKEGISKFNKGQLLDFGMNNLAVPFSGKGKLFTDTNTSNLYLLDSGNNRVLIIGKNGALIATLRSPEFTDLKDLQVNEKNKTMYLLNEGSLLKVALP